MTSILETDYIEQTRPYSQDELLDIRSRLYRQLRLGKYKAYHLKCSHIYLVKENSKKEKEILEDSSNIGNCSVCWKISKTHSDLKHKARDLVTFYMTEFYNDDVKLTYNLSDLENIFYKWLYLDH